MHLRPIVAALGLLIVAVTFAACTEGSGDDTPPTPTPTLEPGTRARSFAMGISSLPAELTDESYAETFELAGQVGEVILIRRTPPWEELLASDSFPSKETTSSTQRERDLAKEHGLQLFVAIDATDVSEDTGQLEGLPADLRGAGFENEDVRSALLRYVQYVLVNYQPAYLAIGVDVNAYQRRYPSDYPSFVSVYEEAYVQVKQAAPETQVFPTFQLEAMRGLLPVDDPGEPQWGLLDDFAARMDLLAFSSYPGVAFDAPEDIPSDYYTGLDERTDKPVAITETGYPSDAPDEGDGDEPPTETEQAAFLRRLLRDADRIDMGLVVWFAGQDPTFEGGASSDLIRHIGLRRRDGTGKAAWQVWRDAVARPFAQAPPAPE